MDEKIAQNFHPSFQGVKSKNMQRLMIPNRFLFFIFFLLSPSIKMGYIREKERHPKNLPQLLA
jgi:hypothetical protein